MGSRYWNQIPATERLIMRTPGWGGEGCWAIEGEGPKGYPYISVNGRRMLAHRFSYLLHVGDPSDLCVLHRCDNPRCVRPDHLFLGTRADNTADMMAKGRNVTHRFKFCKYGHLIADVGPRGGRRRCLACHRVAEERRRSSARDI